MESKLVLTREDMIFKLKTRGLKFRNEHECERILQRINYQKLVAYRFKFIKKNCHYKLNSYFEDLYALYKFDKELKFICMEVIESIELSLRTQIAYELGNSFGSHCYLDHNLFKNIYYHSDFLSKLNKKLQRNNVNNHIMVKHHHHKYSDDLPIYKVIELTTFGMISRLFKNLKDPSKIVDNYYKRLSYKVKSKNLSSWFITLTDIRNICAHHELLYNQEFELSSIRNSDWKKGIYKNKGNKEIYSLFGIFLIFKYTCQDKDLFNSSLEKLENIFQNYSDVICPSSDMKFPNNWKNILNR